MAFNSDFFTYTTSVDPTTYVTSGTLTTVSGSTAGNSPLGRVLRETGRKLVPGANPGITVYMVEVFDNTTFLRGYINPNSPVFAPFNSDKPAFMEEPYVINQDVSGGTYGAPGAFGGTQNYGASVLTRGNILTDGYVESGGQIRCLQSVSLSLEASPTAVVPALAQTFTCAINAPRTFTVDTSLVSIGDRITFFLVGTGAGGTVTFGTGFGSVGTLSVSAGSYYTITFQAALMGAAGLKMWEISRTAALTPV